MPRALPSPSPLVNPLPCRAAASVLRCAKANVLCMLCSEAGGMKNPHVLSITSAYKADHVSPAAFLFSAMFWKDSHRRDTYVNVLAVEGALYAVTLFLGDPAQPACHCKYWQCCMKVMAIHESYGQLWPLLLSTAVHMRHPVGAGSSLASLCIKCVCLQVSSTASLSSLQPLCSEASCTKSGPPTCLECFPGRWLRWDPALLIVRADEHLRSMWPFGSLHSAHLSCAFSHKP